MWKYGEYHKNVNHIKTVLQNTRKTQYKLDEGYANTIHGIRNTNGQ